MSNSLLYVIEMELEGEVSCMWILIFSALLIGNCIRKARGVSSIITYLYFFLIFYKQIIILLTDHLVKNV